MFGKTSHSNKILNAVHLLSAKLHIVRRLICLLLIFRYFFFALLYLSNTFKCFCESTYVNHCWGRGGELATTNQREEPRVGELCSSLFPRLGPCQASGCQWLEGRSFQGEEVAGRSSLQLIAELAGAADGMPGLWLVNTVVLWPHYWHLIGPKSSESSVTAWSPLAVEVKCKFTIVNNVLLNIKFISYKVNSSLIDFHTDWCYIFCYWKRF